MSSLFSVSGNFFCRNKASGAVSIIIDNGCILYFIDINKKKVDEAEANF